VATTERSGRYTGLDELVEGAVRHLASFDRPSASAGERRAAEWIATALEAEGCAARVEPERAHGGYWWPFGLLNGLAVLGALLGGLRGRLLAAFATAALVDDTDHRSRWFRRAFLPQRPTYNVVAKAGDRGAKRTVVVVGHHDAAHGGQIFDPSAVRWFARRFPERHAAAKRWPRLVRLVVAPPLLVALGFRRVGAFLALGNIASMIDVGRRPAVPGANDNLTGVGVLLGLARRLREEPVEGLRVLLLSTGSEESNSEGMAAFGRRHFAGLPRSTTTFVAVDTVGSGLLCLGESEGFLWAHPYDDELKDLASACAAELGITLQRGLHISFATDGQIALHGGYRALVLGSIDELKLPRNYHQPTDVPDNVDFPSVLDAVRLCEAVVRRIAAQG